MAAAAAAVAVAGIDKASMFVESRSSDDLPDELFEFCRHELGQLDSGTGTAKKVHGDPPQLTVVCIKCDLVYET